VNVGTGLYLYHMNEERMRLVYVTDGCLWTINSKGRLRVLYVPFRVLCIKKTHSVPENTWVYVEAVISHKEFRIAYLINGIVYPYHFFQLIMHF
jgi:hypothetical protein